MTTIKNKIKQTLREYDLDVSYGKRPDMLVDKLEQLVYSEAMADTLCSHRSQSSESTDIWPINAKPLIHRRKSTLAAKAYR